jgi:hypothetical protein
MTRILLSLNLLLCASALAETRYYLVEGTMELPTGRRVGTSLSLAKRTVDRTAGKIDEVVLSMKGQEPAHASPRAPRTACARSRRLCPPAIARCAAAPSRGPRHRRTPSKCRASPRSRRDRTPGKRWDARLRSVLLGELVYDMENLCRLAPTPQKQPTSASRCQ